MLSLAGRVTARAMAFVGVAPGFCALSCAHGADGFTPFVDSDARAPTTVSALCDNDGAPATPLAPPVTDGASFADAGGDDAENVSLGAVAEAPGDTPDAERTSLGADAGAGDETSTADDDAAVPAPAPARPGDLAITEIMIAPSGAQPDSEWFELYNLTTSPKRLDGLVIQDGLSDAHVIASSPSTVVPPLAYAVLARDRSAALNALVPSAAIVYEYGAGLSPANGIELNAGTGGDLSVWNGSVRLVDVPYGAWNAAFPGQSIELAGPQADPSVAQNWCVAQTPWATGADDGTPGGASDCAP